MIDLLLSLIAAARGLFRSRTDIALEILALRQQVAVLKRKRPRPRLSPLDRLFWTVLRTTWSHWRDALVIVKPETFLRWHREAFRLFWRWEVTPLGSSSAAEEYQDTDSKDGPGESDLGRRENRR